MQRYYSLYYWRGDAPYVRYVIILIVIRILNLRRGKISLGKMEQLELTTKLHTRVELT